jgi:hypothetical protein
MGEARQSSTARPRLLRDFERRLRYSEAHPDPSDILRTERSIAIVVHPTADEPELLARFGLTPEHCTRVDAYWQYGDRVYWIECSGKLAVERASGLYYSLDNRHRQDRVLAVVPEVTITSCALRQTFSVLETLIDGGRIECARDQFAGDWIPLHP